jgi:hypothetical protein
MGTSAPNIRCADFSTRPDVEFVERDGWIGEQKLKSEVGHHSLAGRVIRQTAHGRVPTFLDN